MVEEKKFLFNYYGLSFLCYLIILLMFVKNGLARPLCLNWWYHPTGTISPHHWHQKCMSVGMKPPIFLKEFRMAWMVPHLFSVMGNMLPYFLLFWCSKNNFRPPQPFETTSPLLHWWHLSIFTHGEAPPCSFLKSLTIHLRGRHEAFNITWFVRQVFFIGSFLPSVPFLEVLFPQKLAAMYLACLDFCFHIKYTTSS